MNFFSRLFKKSEQAKPPQEQHSADISASSTNAKPIIVYDHFGREYSIDREKWRTSVLPDTLKAAWNQPDRLYSIIASAAENGFASDVMDEALHLFQTDHDKRRSTCLWGALLAKAKRFSEAETILVGYVTRHVIMQWFHTFAARRRRGRFRFGCWM